MIQFNFEYDLEQVHLILSGDGLNLLAEDLKGKKSGKFLGLKRRYSGAFSRPVKVPVGVRLLTVHIESPDKSVDITRPIVMIPPNGKEPSLHVTATSNKLEFSWK
jgi:hypothetical protein